MSASNTSRQPIKRADGVTQHYHVTVGEGIATPTLPPLAPAAVVEAEQDSISAAWEAVQARSNAASQEALDTSIDPSDIAHVAESLDNLGLKAANRVMSMTDRYYALERAGDMGSHLRAMRLRKEIDELRWSIRDALEGVHTANQYLDGDYISPPAWSTSAVIDADNISVQAVEIKDKLDELDVDDFTDLDLSTQVRYAQANRHLRSARRAIKRALNPKQD